jgi:arginine exporter protein ArgO
MDEASEDYGDNHHHQQHTSQRKTYHVRAKRRGHPLIMSASILCIIIDIALIALVVFHHAPVETIQPALLLTMALTIFLLFMGRRK